MQLNPFLLYLLVIFVKHKRNFQIKSTEEQNEEQNSFFSTEVYVSIWLKIEFNLSPFVVYINLITNNEM